MVAAALLALALTACKKGAGSTCGLSKDCKDNLVCVSDLDGPSTCMDYEAAKLATDFDPENRDENVDYYVAKLDELVKKFAGVTVPEATQATLL